MSLSTRQRQRVTAMLLLLALCGVQSAHAYSHFSLSGGARLRWEAPRVRWFATERGAPGVSATEFQAALARALTTWEAVPTASVAFEFVGFTSAEPFEEDDLSVFGFQSQPEMDRVLGATTFVIDELTGEIVESDVFFNSAFAWSTAAGGDPERFDLQSVALHEIGHFVGLGHSALGETELRPEGGRRVLGSAAVMFPISLGRGSTSGMKVKTPAGPAPASRSICSLARSPRDERRAGRARRGFQHPHRDARRRVRARRRG